MAKKAAGPEEPTTFGVFQQKTGSLTLGDFRFVPLTATSVPESTKELACEDSSPVKFYDTEEAAKEAIGKLKAKFDSQPKTQTT